MKERGCADQIFAVKQICEKAKRKRKKVFMGFMDLEKAYDSVNRKGLWQVLSMYGVSGKLLEGIKSLHEGSKACVRVNGTLSEWFEIKNGVKQGCVMSPWLFNIFMDGVMKEVRQGMGTRGVRLVRGREEWWISDLLYADDVVFVAESERELRELIDKFNRVCKRRGLKVNADKSKVMIMGGTEDDKCEIKLNGQVLEHVKEFCYLGSTVNDRGTDESDCNKRVMKERKTAGSIRALVNERVLV